MKWGAMTTMKKLVDFFLKNKTKERIQILSEQINAQQSSLRQLKDEYDAINSWYIEYYNMLNELTVDMDAAVWSKNANHEYIIANPIHCREFFGIDNTPDCLEYVRGKTDSRLIELIYKENGFKNTYEDICTLSDEYAKARKEPTHFLEAGYINEEQVLFYAIKYPKFKDDVFIGSNGIAWNFTDRASTVINMLNRWIYDNKVSTVFCKDDVFCHAINPTTEEQCDIFKHICPNPVQLGCGCDRVPK